MTSPATKKVQLPLEPLFPGDSGQLDLDCRRVLVRLLAGPSIDATHHSKLWPALLLHEKEIRQRLSELFLELVLDYDMQVAFIREADTGELDTPRLLRHTKLSFLDSVLMLYLRQCLTEADIQGERTVVAETEIYEQLALYEKIDNSDKAGFQRRIHAAIENAKKRNIITRIKSSDMRYEVSPALKLLFSAEAVHALKIQYQHMLPNQGALDE